MKNRLTLAFLVVLGGFGYGAYEYYDFTTVDVPAMEQERQGLEGQFAAKQGEYNQLKDFAQNIETIKQELRELNAQLESALEHMPRSFNLSGLLRKLTMLAQSSGVELSTFKPTKSEARSDSGFYSTISIDFDLRGSFTQNLVFFDQLSRLKRIINIDSLKMSAKEVSGAKTGTVLVDTQGSIRTYRFME